MCVCVCVVCAQESDGLLIFGSMSTLQVLMYCNRARLFLQAHRWQANALSVAFPPQSLANDSGLLDSPRSSPPPGMEAYGQIINVATVVQKLSTGTRILRAARLPRTVPNIDRMCATAQSISDLFFGN